MSGTENIHASCVARGERAILLFGDSGSGKSDLALQLIERGFDLVSDDRTDVIVDDGVLRASPPATIAGKLEVRGIGIVEMNYRSDVPVALAVELGEPPQRLPDAGATRAVAGIDLPLVHIDAFTSSAPAKVVLAMSMLGSGE